MSDRITRKDIKHDVQHDRFVEEMETAYGAVRRNAMKIGAVIAGIVALAGVALGVFAYQKKQEEKAQILLAEAIATMEKPVATDAASGEEAVFKTQDEKIAKAEPLFRKVVEQYRGKDAADIAELYLARIAAGRGDVKTAEPKVRAFLDEHSDHVLAGAAQLSLYQIQLGSGAAREVIADIERQLKAENPVLPKDVLLSTLARAYETIGDEAKARDAYQRLVNEFPDSTYTIDAQRKIARG